MKISLVLSIVAAAAMFDLVVSAHLAKRGVPARWTDGVVPYKFNNSLDKSIKRKIKAIMTELSEKTCIVFRRRSKRKDSNWLEFTGEGNGCATQVGKSSNPGAQLVSLGAECDFRGIVIHAVTHALGYTDEQNKSDQLTRELIIRDSNQFIHLTRDYISRDELSVDELVGINRLYECTENLGSLANMSDWTPWTPCNADCVSSRSRFCNRNPRLRIIYPADYCTPATDVRGIETETKKCC